MTSWRPPASQSRRDGLAIAYARDGYALLEAVYDSSAPAWLRELPAVDVLRRVLVQNYTRVIGEDGREVIKRREKEPEGGGLPPRHAPLASPYDLDAPGGVKPDTFWLGYKLHITETCDDPAPTSPSTTTTTSSPARKASPQRPGRRAPKEAKTRSWPPSPPATAAPARPAPCAPPAARTGGSSPCCPVTWPKPKPPPAPRKPRSASRPTTRAGPASRAPCTRPPAMPRGVPATAACPRPASTTYTWPAPSTSSGWRLSGPAPRWTGSEPATWHASNSASPHDPEL